MASDPHLPQFFCYPLLWLGPSRALAQSPASCVFFPFLPVSHSCFALTCPCPPFPPSAFSSPYYYHLISLLFVWTTCLMSSWHLLCLHRSSLAHSDFQQDALTSCIYKMGCCNSPQRSHIFPRKVQGRLSREQFGGLKKRWSCQSKAQRAII